MNRRTLVEHLIRKRELVLTKAASSGERFSSLKNLERAEKRFLASFLTTLVGSSFTLAWRLWGLDIYHLLSLPLSELFTVVFAAAMILSSVSAILAYLSIGFVVQRAVEIKPRD